ncbi:APC family permease [Glacieibacterium frigidum]|uniref:Arginine/agmatine antiporter n=1 Tax=Glacieibacterium frigidum TaxID=2593303 RepID=A0A552UA39_9SPHN|nr:APC family permease [Glacieibacterium frigidum]TRW15087.1 amino acid permease [Glacieibacterium frigidum]
MSDTARPFGFWTATALVVGGMIGSAIFVLPAALAPFGWTGVLAWVVGIGGALCVAYALGRLAATMPHSTGAIAVTGAVLGDLPAVLIGWSYWISCWAACAALSIAATGYLAVFWPALAATPARGAAAALVILWLLTLLNLRGARAAGRFQIVTTLLKLLPLLVVVGIVALAAGAGEVTPPPLPAAADVFAGLTPAVTLTLFALVGFEATGVAAERIRDPGRTVLRATMAGTALTGVLYLVVATGIGFMLPPERLAGSVTPFALFVETFWGRGPALLVALFAAVAAIGALGCWVLLQSEVPLGMARAGLLPRWFGIVSARDVPVRVTLLSSVLASVLILAAGSDSLAGLYVFVGKLVTSTTLYLYLAICVAALIRRVAVIPAALGVPFTLWAMWGAGIEASGLGLLLTLTALPLYWMRGQGAIAPQPR